MHQPELYICPFPLDPPSHLPPHLMPLSNEYFNWSDSFNLYLCNHRKSPYLSGYLRFIKGETGIVLRAQSTNTKKKKKMSKKNPVLGTEEALDTKCFVFFFLNKGQTKQLITYIVFLLQKT